MKCNACQVWKQQVSLIEERRANLVQDYSKGFPSKMYKEIEKYLDQTATELDAEIRNLFVFYDHECQSSVCVFVNPNIMRKYDNSRRHY